MLTLPPPYLQHPRTPEDNNNEDMDNPLYNSWSWVDSSARVNEDDEDDDVEFLKTEEPTDEDNSRKNPSLYGSPPQDQRLETMPPLAAHKVMVGTSPLFLLLLVLQRPEIRIALLL